MTNNKTLGACPAESMTKAEQRVLDILARLNRDADSALGRGRHDDYRAAVNRMIDVQDAFYDSFGRMPGRPSEGA